MLILDAQSMKKVFLLIPIIIIVISFLFSSGSAVQAEQLKVGGEVNQPQQQTSEPMVIHSIHQDRSIALIDIPLPSQPEALSVQEPFEMPSFQLPKAAPGSSALRSQGSQIMQSEQSSGSMPAPLQSFDGVENLFRGWPPDTQGDIGPDHYVQWINTSFAIWQINRTNQTATKVFGPVPGNTLFQGFGGACETTNHGDPITLYDSFADRWFMSQFALPNFPDGPFYECIAVSVSPDPTGAWYRYEFQMPVNKMNDYPKFGVWPDAYYMSVNQFNGGSSTWGGAGVAALERSMMLIGQPAKIVYFDLYAVNSNFGGILPADFDGLLRPPEGSPGFFAEWDDGEWIPSQDALRLWEFHVDWSDPSQSSFGLSGNPNQVLPTFDVDPDMCSYSRSCIPQPGTNNRVDAISDRLMFRLQYRNFGMYQTLISNHTVDINGADQAGIHWFELRRLSASSEWEMQQQGIHSPDPDHRWMGSIALDHVGNIALGYSVSSSSTFPSVRYAGRLVTDPSGELSQAEASLVAGSGSQTQSNRWGDYSMMAVDPVDDCTFWYTQQYVAVTGTNTWKTRIGSFRFPNCSIGPQGKLQGTTTSSSTGLPLAGVSILARRDDGFTGQTNSQANGHYELLAFPGNYAVEASKFGYLSQSFSDIQIMENQNIVLDIALTTAPTYTISGIVQDANTGWPIYSKISIPGTPFVPVWTNPITGAFDFSLPAGVTITLNIEAFLQGYTTSNFTLSPLSENINRNFSLPVESSICNAPGYEVNISPLYFSDFEGNNGNLSLEGLSSWKWGMPTNGPANAKSGQKVWATGLISNYLDNENGYLKTPVIDLSVQPGLKPVIQWWQWLQTERNYDFATIEASKDGGNTWQPVYGPVSGKVDSSWTLHTIILDPSFAVNNFQARFNLKTDQSINLAGWFLDDLTIGGGSCQPPAGGLVIGNVFDANTSSGLVDANIINGAGFSAISQATPLDPAVADGLFALYSPSGNQVVTATHTFGYEKATQSTVVPSGNTIGVDFQLLAGKLSISPEQFDVTLELGSNSNSTLIMDNLGGRPVEFSLIELEGGVVPLGPFETPGFAVKPFRQQMADSSQLSLPVPPVAPVVDGGNVLRSWSPDNVLNPWGVAYEAQGARIWVNSPGPGWDGKDRLYEFTLQGDSTGLSFPHESPHQFGPADLAYNWNTGKIWAMNINSEVANCIYEIDPLLGYTGQKICPGGGSGFQISQRGLAYDPTTDTWFAGGWNDMMIYRFNSEGVILAAISTEIPIAGMAYNPQSSHLFILSNSNPTRVYILDVNENYGLIGQFSISQGFGPQSGGGLEIDCEGNLWGIDQVSDMVYQFSSGERAELCHFDVPWLVVQPNAGDIPANSPSQIDVDFTANSMDQPGDYNAQLKIRHNTPYLITNIPINLTVNPPPGWGKLAGQVTEFGYCDIQSKPSVDAQVFIESSSGASWTLQTDSNGYFRRWVDEAGSPYTVTVSKPELSSKIISNIIVTGGLTTTVEFDLHWITYFFPLILN